MLITTEELSGLTINVWAPKGTKAGADLPVVVVSDLFSDNRTGSGSGHIIVASQW